MSGMMFGGSPAAYLSPTNFANNFMQSNGQSAASYLSPTNFANNFMQAQPAPGGVSGQAPTSTSNVGVSSIPFQLNIKPQTGINPGFMTEQPIQTINPNLNRYSWASTPASPLPAPQASPANRFIPQFAPGSSVTQNNQYSNSIVGKTAPVAKPTVAPAVKSKAPTVIAKSSTGIKK